MHLCLGKSTLRHDGNYDIHRLKHQPSLRIVVRPVVRLVEGCIRAYQLGIRPKKSVKPALFPG
jgi:hypothetical protein